MSDVEPYALDPHFELALVYLCCCRPRFYSKIGVHLDPEALDDEGAQLALRIAKVVAQEKGTGPSSLSIIGQRLHRLKMEGKATSDQIDDVMDIFEAVEENGVPEEEDVISEIAPVLKRRANGVLVKDAISAYGKQGDLTSIASKIEAVERIGKSENSIGIGFDGAWDEIEELSKLERLPVGILELDSRMDGGAERGSLTCYVGGPGDGKSMMLQQVACNAILKKMNVAYATLELNKAKTYNRIISNLTSIPMSAISGNRLAEARRKIQSLQPTLGLLYVEQFTPQIATVLDIKEWVKRIEEHTGEEIHLVVVDYGDKLASDDNKEQNGYIASRDVFEKFRIWMEETNKWGFTASQSKRKDKMKALIDINDLADSQHKARVVDIVITLNVTEDEDGNKQVKFFIAKNRNGESGSAVGPLECEFHVARIAGVSRGDAPPKQKVGTRELDYQDDYD